jgi:ribosomal protein S12 methylthiotransferase accessory factor
MDIAVTFPGGKRVDAAFGEWVVRTDQPVELGGNGTAPAPFDFFVASLATCAGIYVLGFCQVRGIPTDGMRLIQHNRFDPATHQLQAVDLEILLPPSFPEKYRDAVIRAAEGCKVKKVLSAPPAISVRAMFTDRANPSARAEDCAPNALR